MSSASETPTGGKVLPLRRGAAKVATEGKDTYLKHIDTALASSADAARKSARNEFSKLAFPTSKQELWKYTSLSVLGRTEYAPPGALTPAEVAAARAVLEKTSTNDKAATCVVLVNGRLSPELSTQDSLPKGVTLTSLRTSAAPGRLGEQAKAAEGVLVALNSALWTDGVHLRVDADTSVELPIELVHVHVTATGSGPSASYPRLVVELGMGAKATLVESHLGGAKGQTFSSPVAEFWLGASSRLSRVVLAWEKGLFFGHTHVSQAKDSEYRSSDFTWGGEVSRAESTVTFAEPGARCVLDGLYLGQDQSHIDHQTLIDHAVPQCTSEELYKGVLGGKSTAIFHGRLFVRADAQKSNASQTNKNLLVSKDATVNTKPGLEIFADDVKAAHGAAVGQLDPTQLFYLRTRGIGVNQAKQILTYAFAREVVERIENEGIRARVDAEVQAQLLALAESEAKR